MKKKKLLIFHPALAPYRIDQFNSLSKLFDLEIVFLFTNVTYQNFNQTALCSQLKFNYSYLLTGPYHKERVFRFGIYKKIKNFNPDIIIGYEYSFTTQYLILLKRLGVIHQKIGSTIDDSLEICKHVQSKIRCFARSFSLKYLDFLIVQSSEVSSFYYEKFNYKNNRVIISPILQKPERLRKEQKKIEEKAHQYQEIYQLKNKKVLLYVGRFIREKGLTQFLNNLANHFKEHENLIFILVGEGEEHQNIENIVKEYHLDNNVLFPGRCESLELYSWYLCASGLVLPSIYEPFGAVVDEALIFGLPVFCTKYAGASSLIHEYNGLIFDPLNEEETNKKFNSFINSIETIKGIDLSKRNPLIDYNLTEFNSQWEKLENN